MNRRCRSPVASTEAIDDALRQINHDVTRRVYVALERNTEVLKRSAGALLEHETRKRRSSGKSP